MPQAAITVARSPSAMATVTCAITAATACVARKGLPGRRPASNPRRFNGCRSARSDTRFLLRCEGERKTRKLTQRRQGAKTQRRKEEGKRRGRDRFGTLVALTIYFDLG